MTAKAAIRRCAVYTRKSSEEGLEQDFNSLQAQREACEAFIRSQRAEGWRLIATAYDDGGLSGGTLERPALQHLLADIGERRVDTVVVYKVDRLTRSLMDFAKIVELFDRHGVTFVAITQQFNTTTSSSEPVSAIEPSSRYRHGIGQQTLPQALCFRHAVAMTLFSARQAA
jgi:site-specific DNA recombinase